MRKQLAFVLTLCAACNGANNGNNGDDDPGADASTGDGGDDGGADGNDAGDGGTIDRCTVPPVGGLAKGEAIRVLGRINAAAVDSNDMRTYAGTYNIAFAGSLDFAGTPAPYASGNDGFVWRRDASGATIWLATFAGSGMETVFAVLDDDAGNIYVTGRTTSATMTFGTLSISSDTLPYVSFIAKLRASDGAPQWLQKITGPTTGTSAQFHSCSKLIKSGTQIVASCNYRGGPLGAVGDGGTQMTIQTIGFQSAVLLAIDPADGEVGWVTRFASSMASGIVGGNATAAPNGNFYVAGTYTQGHVDIAHPGAATLRSTNPNGSTGRSAFWTELDAAGEPLWVGSFEDLQAGTGDGPFDLAIATGDDSLYLTIASPSGIHFAIGSQFTPGFNRDLLATYPLASPPQNVPTHVREIPTSSKLAVDRCDRPALATAWVDQDDLIVDGVAVTANRTGLLTLDGSATATKFVGFDPCANAFSSCDPRNATSAVVMTPTGGTIVVGAFNPRIDFGSGSSGLGNGEQPFIAEFAP